MKAVITGAAGVYGRALARAFAGAGASLCLSDRDAGPLGSVAAELGLPGGRLLAHAADLADEAAIADLVGTVGREWGAPDVLVNNAGIYPFQDIMTVGAAEWDAIMDVNLRAPFLLMQGMGRLMIERGVKGSIVNVGSPAANMLRTNGLPYCVSKRGLDWLSKGFALALGPHGIRVNLVEPGLALGSAQIDIPPAHTESLAKGIPLGRIGEAQDLPGAVLFLCSPAAAYITGASIPVDGGGSIPRRPPV